MQSYFIAIQAYCEMVTRKEINDKSSNNWHHFRSLNYNSTITKMHKISSSHDVTSEKGIFFIEDESYPLSIFVCNREFCLYWIEKKYGKA